MIKKLKSKRTKLAERDLTAKLEEDKALAESNLTAKLEEDKAFKESFGSFFEDWDIDLVNRTMKKGRYHFKEVELRDLIYHYPTATLKDKIGAENFLILFTDREVEIIHDEFERLASIKTLKGRKIIIDSFKKNKIRSDNVSA